MRSSGDLGTLSAFWKPSLSNGDALDPLSVPMLVARGVESSLVWIAFWTSASFCAKTARDSNIEIEKSSCAVHDALFIAMSGELQSPTREVIDAQKDGTITIAKDELGDANAYGLLQARDASTPTNTQTTVTCANACRTSASLT